MESLFCRQFEWQRQSAYKDTEVMLGAIIVMPVLGAFLLSCTWDVTLSIFNAKEVPRSSIRQFSTLNWVFQCAGVPTICLLGIHCLVAVIVAATVWADDVLLAPMIRGRIKNLTVLRTTWALTAFKWFMALVMVLSYIMP